MGGRRLESSEILRYFRGLPEKGAAPADRVAVRIRLMHHIDCLEYRTMSLLNNRSRFNRSFDYSHPEKKSTPQVTRRITVVSPESGSRRVALRNTPQDRPFQR